MLLELKSTLNNQKPERKRSIFEICSTVWFGFVGTVLLFEKELSVVSFAVCKVLLKSPEDLFGEDGSKWAYHKRDLEYKHQSWFSKTCND